MPDQGILVVEDDVLLRRSLKKHLEECFDVRVADSAEEATLMMEKEIPTVVLQDIQLPGISGIELLRRIRASHPRVLVIMMTAVEDVASVVECMKLGAYDYLVKPVAVEELLLTIRRALETAILRKSVEQRETLQLLDNSEYRLLGGSKEMEQIRRDIARVAQSDAVVLVEGETGTGKEFAARNIHAAGRRARDPFVALNCGAIPKELIESELFGHKKGAYTGAAGDGMGKFQLANRGTLLLDEIGELPPDSQSKLLRVLDRQEFYQVGGTELVRVNVRIIASTNRKLDEMVRQGQFREDLFYRLSVYPLKMPPLRARKEDIVPLAEHFLSLYNKEYFKNFVGIESNCGQLLLDYRWPGNLRELRNVIERVVLSHDDSMVRLSHLSCLIQDSSSNAVASADFKLPVDGIDFEELERSLLSQALLAAKGNKTRAAKLLKLSTPAFSYRLEKYSLE